MNCQACIYDIPWPREKAFKNKDRLLMIEKSGPCPSSILSNVAWYHHPEDPGRGQHYFDCGELLAFVGSDPERPDDLGGQVTLYMNGEKAAPHLQDLLCLCSQRGSAQAAFSFFGAARFPENRLRLAPALL